MAQRVSGDGIYNGRFQETAEKDAVTRAQFLRPAPLLRSHPKIARSRNAYFPRRIDDEHAAG